MRHIKYLAGNQLSQERLVKEKDSLPCLRDSSVMIGSWIPVHSVPRRRSALVIYFELSPNFSRLVRPARADSRPPLAIVPLPQDLPISSSTPIPSHQDSLGLNLSD